MFVMFFACLFVDSVYNFLNFSAHRSPGMFDEIVLLWSWSPEASYETLKLLFRMDLGDGGCSCFPIPLVTVYSAQQRASSGTMRISVLFCFCLLSLSVSCQPIP